MTAPLPNNSYPIPASSGTNKVPMKTNILPRTSGDQMVQNLRGSGADLTRTTDIGGGVFKSNLFGNYTVSATATALLSRHTDYISSFTMTNTGSNTIYISGRAAWVSNNVSAPPNTVGSVNDDCFALNAGQSITFHGIHAHQLLFGCLTSQTSTLQVYGA
jgi:hypothetical protein